MTETGGIARTERAFERTALGWVFAKFVGLPGDRSRSITQIPVSALELVDTRFQRQRNLVYQMKGFGTVATLLQVVLLGQQMDLP